MTDLVFPTIHLNGTSKEALQEQIQTAHHALYQAKDALCKTAPHGRDYYPQGHDAINVAIDQYRSRLERIESIMNELVQIHDSMNR